MLTTDELMRLADWNLERAAFYEQAAAEADARTQLLAEALGCWRRARARHFRDEATLEPGRHRELGTEETGYPPRSTDSAGLQGRRSRPVGNNGTKSHA